MYGAQIDFILFWHTFTSVIWVIDHYFPYKKEQELLFNLYI